MHITRDARAASPSWENVTPPDAPDFVRINTIDSGENRVALEMPLERRAIVRDPDRGAPAIALRGRFHHLEDDRSSVISTGPADVAVGEAPDILFYSSHRRVAHSFPAPLVSAAEQQI